MSRLQAEKSEKESSEQYYFRASAADFEKIPGCPVAYWANKNVFDAFGRSKKISSVTTLHRGISTGNNDKFARQWFEVSNSALCLWASDRQMAENSGARWFPYNRGGAYRKWYGLGSDVIDYEDGGQRKLVSSERGDTPGFRHDGSSEYFRETITWTALTAGKPSFRLLKSGYVLGHKGSSIKVSSKDRLPILGLLSSNVLERFLEYVSPTLDINIAQISALPLPEHFDIKTTGDVTSRLVDLSRNDWDSSEVSWDFTCTPLLHVGDGKASLSIVYRMLRAEWQRMVFEAKELEERDNKIFIQAYGLEGELSPEVPLTEITLTCNPHYRYGNDKSEDELEALLLADTMRELISYAVGCMLGRYSLDKPGLMLANQGDTLQQYLDQVPDPSFAPDEDNVVPMLEGDWFSDDIAERFRAFMRVAFGNKNLDENIAFIESAIGKDLRKYFLKDFYTDHVRRYKKRPIYWMFSSSKGSFNALIYMHRYRPDTASIVLNDYLREFRTKLTAKKGNLDQVTISASASQREKTQALKQIEKIDKTLDEINEYEHEVLYPLATQQVEIDLDDGVKVNYPKFGKALKKVPGLS